MGGSSTKPEFKSYIHDKKVKRGEDVEFRCEANLEDLEVKWSKDEQRLYSGDRISISQSGTNLSLRIRGAKEEDEGKYSVRISNDSDSASDSAKVTVLEYDRDWRSIEWGANVDIKHSLQDLRLRNPQVKHLRILLHGPVGAGKSSIINSINSIFQYKVKVGVLAAAESGTTFTKTFKTHQIRDNQGRALALVFNDIMGLENEVDEGVHPDDIISALEGHIKENYRFDPRRSLSERDPSYNTSPTLSDKVHCLVCVLPADKISLMKDEVIEKMQDIREHASELGIPQVVFMTRVDLGCSLVKEDLRRTYSSKYIKQKMQECSNKLGIPMNCIFPIKNYHEENNLDNYMDSLILDALKNVVNFAEDYVDDLETDTQLAESPELSETSADEQPEDSDSGLVCQEFSQDQTDSLLKHEAILDWMPDCTPAVDREFDREWRKINMDTMSRNRMEKELKEFRLLNPDLKHLRILLHGPVGAGKSSIINSIDSVFQGQVSARALAAAESGISFTKKYKTHKFRNGNSGYLPFVVNDIMGLEKGDSVGAHPSDIISALKGHIKNNHKFNPASPLSVGDADYVTSPTLSDQVHCLVSVIPMDKISIMDDDVINKMLAIREAASDMDIPQAIVMTMVDKACPVVKEDLRKIYFSKKIKQLMQECSNRLGVPMNCIFPVKNYHEETDLNQEMDCLILTALRQIVHFAHEYIDSLDD